MTTQTISRTAPPNETAGTGSRMAAGAGRLVVYARRIGGWFAERARVHSWLRTLFAVTAALAICAAAVVYTPIEAPASWRSASSSVTSVRPAPSD